MRKVYTWIVAITAVMNLLLGLSTIIGAKTPEMLANAGWPASWVTGGFLIFAAVLLFWASFDVERRAPVLFWEGLLRLWAAFTFSQAMDNPMAPAVIAMDGTIGVIYLAGLFLIFRLSLKTAAWGAPARS